ncbi:hypothetical protein AgCh_024958 [Apium graveolens]
MLQQNLNSDKPQNANVSFTYNEDGSVNLLLNDDFLKNGIKQWESSITCHFIGGIFDFKFVRDHAFKLWKNKELSRVYYSSKGYFTFRFNTVANKNIVLNLNSVQMGGKTLFLRPWMEGNKFMKNIVNKVLIWIGLSNVPFPYWSSKGLTAIVETDGTRDREKIEIEYSMLPYSCMLRKAFGHSLSRCIDNLERIMTTPKQRVNLKENGSKRRKTSELKASNTELENDIVGHETYPGDKGTLEEDPIYEENYLQNNDNEINVIGKFLGCDITMNDDEVVKSKLIKLNKDHGNVHNNVLNARQKLHRIHEDLISFPYDHILNVLEKDTTSKLQLCLSEEEHFLKQKARVKWLSLGDGNNSFLFNKVRSNWNHNKILAIEDNNGKVVFGQSSVAKVVVDFFVNSIGTSTDQVSCDPDFVQCKTIKSHQASFMTEPVTNDLIFKTLRAMRKYKSPGPNGFTMELEVWDIVGEDFYKAIKHFFQTMIMHSGINITLLFPNNTTRITEGGLNVILASFSRF